MRFEVLLRMLPEKELGAIVAGLELKVDPSKRIDTAAQVARALLARPEARDWSLLPEGAAQLLRRLIEAGGVARVSALPAALQPLVALGIVFARRAAQPGRVELILPAAYLLQLPLGPGEDPRGLRALLLQGHPDVKATIASHYLGSSATHPLALALESAWLVLTDPSSLRAELDSLTPEERRVLESVWELGGEVCTEELLELEREPLRLRTASGQAPSRRGVAFALERRGLLVPVHPDRHVVPSEVARAIGFEAQQARIGRRRQIVQDAETIDHTPRTAQFSIDPVPLALAMAWYVRERSVDIKPGVGTARSLLSRLSTRFGQPLPKVSLVAALSRAIGLWDASAGARQGTTGALSLAELHLRLFDLWRVGGVWDEAREEPELARSAAVAKDASVIGGVRELVLSTLSDLAEDRWVPWDFVLDFVTTDPRSPGLQRLLDRWGKRAGATAEQTRLPAVVDRIVFESLFQLGCVDVSALAPAAEAPSRALRVTPRGRSLLRGHLPTGSGPSQFVGHHALRLGQEARVAQVLDLFAFTEVARVDGVLEVALTPAALSQALAHGAEVAQLQRRLQDLAEVPEPVLQQLSQASTVLGRVEHVATSGFLWVDDPELRELLLTRRATADLFVDPSPPGGLLLAPGVELERVVLRCRGLGIEVMAQGGSRRLTAADLQPPSEVERQPSTRSPRQSADRSSAPSRRLSTHG